MNGNHHGYAQQDTHFLNDVLTNVNECPHEKKIKQGEKVQKKKSFVRHRTMHNKKKKKKRRRKRRMKMKIVL